MEPPRYSIKIPNIMVTRVEERQGRTNGWYLSLDGSWEALFVGDTRPNIRPGDLVTIRIEKQ